MRTACSLESSTLTSIGKYQEKQQGNLIGMTYIDGIASSQALDTSGEIVDLKGLDVSSLISAAINYEHKKDFPSQIVGKIIEAKKIFGKEDCENPRHLHFWNKVGLPFLYIKARLFDDDKPSSQEVAALFRDDAAHPDEPDMLGFSVEGAKIAKEGAVITRSIARLVTVAIMPANKSCIAEIVPEIAERPVNPNDISELFKGEMQLFAFEPTYIQIIEKKEELKKDVGSGGGAFIGSSMAMSEKKLKKNAPPPVASAPPPPMTASNISAGFNGAMGIHKKEKKDSKKMKKALTAGSGMAAPSQLVGGAALAVEDLDGKKKKLHKKEKSQWYNRADDAYKTWDKREHFRKYMKDRMPHLAEGEVDAIGRVLALKKNLQAEGKLSKMYASYFSKSVDSMPKEPEVEELKAVNSSRRGIGMIGMGGGMRMMEKSTDVMMASEDYIHGLPKGHPSLGEHKGHTYRRIRPPVAGDNTYHVAIRHPSGKNSVAKLPASTGGLRDAIHSHIDKLPKE